MVRSGLTIFLFFLATDLAAQSSIRIRVDSLPVSPGRQDLYLAGSFNNWNPRDTAYKFQDAGSGKYYINLKLPAGNYTYKITRGSWQSAECRSGGTDRENRILPVSGDETFRIKIENWKDNFPGQPVRHTASRHVKVIDTAFLIPQLQRRRRVWIYLPGNYPEQRYPVLYLQDGQNIFDEATSFAGEWGVDEFLDSAGTKPCIVVAIDNGGGKRLNEYCPYDFTAAGLSQAAGTYPGEGDQYVDFLVGTLKPFIDNTYRTLGDKSNTFVAGSSMGGLISLYAVLKYPDVFGGAGVFSPAFWVGPRIFKDILAKGKKVNTRIFFYAGKKESESMVPDMMKAFDGLAAVSASNLIMDISDEGKHNEQAWRKEFPLFYYWIMNTNGPGGEKR